MPAVAPFVAAFRRRLANLPGPVRASGEASNGEPVVVELWVDGVWVDISSYTLVRDDSGSIRLTKGIRGEGSQTDHATSDPQLRNTDGRFSPRNPVGPYFGLIGRNTPIRYSVPDGNGGKSYRLWGEVSDWAQDWERSGNDVWTEVEVSGIIRRLAQGPLPEHSVIYDAITDPLLPSVVAYWPCEDASTATSIATPLTNGSRMSVSGTADLASYDGFKASDPLPDLTTATLSGGIARYSDPTATQVRFLAFIPQAGLSEGKVLCSIDQEPYGGASFWELYYTETGHTLVLRQHDSDGAALGATLTHTVDVRGRQMYISVELEESGTGVSRAVRVTDINSRQVYSVTDTAAATQLTRATRVKFGPASRSVVGPIGTEYLPGVAVGHVTVETAITATTALGVRVNPIGEAAGRRIQRLCDQEGIPFQWIGDLDDTVAMGAQGRQNPLSLMRECVEADGGMLYETTDALGLGYRTRASLYNQDPALTLDYAAYNLASVPVPVEDDQRTANRVTVTANGVSQTYEETEGRLSTALPPAGVGVYGPPDVALNLAASDAAALLDQAAWRVHLGTVDEARHPQISVNLAHSSFVDNPALKQAVLALRQGDRILVQNPPPWLPPDDIDQLVLGFEESITHFEHRLTFICAPASPYAVGVLDDDDTRIDTDGSELVSAVSSSDTSLLVTPSAGQSTLWVTDPDEFPFNVRFGGEVATVTAITPAVEDAFGRTVASGWGSADVGGAWSTSGGSATDFAVASGVGTQTHTTAGVRRIATITAPSPDFDVYMSTTTSATATGGSLFSMAAARYADVNNQYFARLEFTTANAITLTLRKRVGGTETQLVSYSVGFTHTPGTYVRLRFQGAGGTLRARVWAAAGGVEPDQWQATVTDSALVSAESLSLWSVTAAGNTNVNPVVSFDDYALVNPQTFTVTRSVNGVVKAHSAGADVRLAVPTVLAL